MVPIGIPNHKLSWPKALQFSALWVLQCFGMKVAVKPGKGDDPNNENNACLDSRSTRHFLRQLWYYSDSEGVVFESWPKKKLTSSQWSRVGKIFVDYFCLCIYLPDQGDEKSWGRWYLSRFQWEKSADCHSLLCCTSGDLEKIRMSFSVSACLSEQDWHLCQQNVSIGSSTIRNPPQQDHGKQHHAVLKDFI